MTNQQFTAVVKDTLEQHDFVASPQAVDARDEVGWPTVTDTHVLRVVDPATGCAFKVTIETTE